MMVQSGEEDLDEELKKQKQRLIRVHALIEAIERGIKEPPKS